MNAFLSGIDLLAPSSLDEALRQLATDPSLRLFAGGTDLMVLLEAGALPPGRYVNLWGFTELRGIRPEGDGVAIGALTTYSDIRKSRLLAERYPLLGRAAAETGGVATQNRGTIGGNIANASPAADTPPALLVYDAELELFSTLGRRRVRYDRFHTGYKQMDLRPSEIIAAIHLPAREVRLKPDTTTPGWTDYYRKVGPRRAQAISKVCVAGAARLDGGQVADIRIALGAVAPTVVRAQSAEAAVRGRAVDDSVIAAARTALAADISPIDDIRSTAEYRHRVAANLVAEFLDRLRSAGL